MRIQSLLRRGSVSDLAKKAGGRIHLGCNDVRIDGFVNVDLRATKATDVVHDCQDLSIFPSDSLSFIYSNAFFEHVYRTSQERLLKDALRTLSSDGWLAFTGLPDFEGVARAYLEQRTPGNVSSTFDLHEAYRYTHGDPEGREDWWLAQLHKVLLDSPTVMKLCQRVGFASCEVFTYCWGNEPNQVTLGFTATKRSARPRSVRDRQVREQLSNVPASINWDSLIVKCAYP
jgi:predicted SAM-dependent methyltransferase